MRTRQRGFTLVEAMLVIGIVGVLSALAMISIRDFARVARTNTASAVLTRTLADARLRSMTQHCPHFVQINGQTYVPGGPTAGAPILRGTASIVRKTNCASTNLFFEVGDRVLNTVGLGDPDIPTGGVRLFVDVPAGLLAGNEVTNTSLTVGYLENGTRGLFLDTAGNGTFVVDAAGTVDLRFGQDPADTFRTLVRMPTNGVATRYCPGC